MKKILKILYIVFFLCLILTNKSEASVKLTGIENFPASYEEILKNIEDTVTVEKVIKPVFNFKAAE